MLHLFTPVGISIFLNLIRWANLVEHPNLEAFQKSWSSCLSNKATKSEKILLTSIIQKKFFHFKNKIENGQIKQQIKVFGNYKPYPNFQASAEIQSINQLLLHPKWEGKKIRLHLIATDSQASELAGEIVKTYYHRNPNVEVISIQKIKNLQIDKSDQFLDDGIQLLVNYIHQQINKPINYKGSNQKIGGLLNITSGYKGITPILTIIGQLLKIPLVYLYERSDNLIEIPPLPLSFNWTQLELFQYCFEQVRANSPKNSDFSENWLKNEPLRSFFYQEMVQNALVREVKEKDGYQITYLGHLLRHHINQVYPMGIRTFGLAFEFLFYELFFNEPLQWRGNTYQWVIHQKNTNNREFDLELRPSRDRTDHAVACEICSYNQLIDFHENEKYAFLKQIKSQVKVFTNGTYHPWGYILLIYGFEGMSDWKRLEFSIQDINQKLTNSGVHHFRVFAVSLPIQIKSKGTQNPYSDLYQRKLTMNKPKWRLGINTPYGNPWLWLEELTEGKINKENL